MIDIQNHIRNEGLLNLFDRMMRTEIVTCTGISVDFTGIPSRTKRVDWVFESDVSVCRGRTKIVKAGEDTIVSYRHSAVD